ncbi:MAG: alpha-galactosidase [Bacteroidales bacterium]|nr:alpha-galactosidase [Bacteroidales bacterium]
MKRILSSMLAAAALVCSCSEPGIKTEPVNPPTMGWSSWNCFLVNISEDIINRHADLLVSTGLSEHGYDHINIDDGFFGHRDSLGYMTAHEERFPNGLRGVADHIHSLGLKAGIYSDAGNNTCGSRWNGDVNGVGAGLWQHEVRDAERYFNDWNFDFIKIDYCGGSGLGLNEHDQYLRIRHAIDSVANHPIEVNICRWAFPGTWVGEAGDSWRISGDVRPFWGSIKSTIERNMYLSAYAGGGRYNDMDMLIVGYANKPSPLLEDCYGVPFNEEETHFGMWCIMSSPLLLGCDLGYIPEETMKIITNDELIALDQDPLGLQAYVVQHDGEGYVFAKDIELLRGKTRAVALYNPSEEEISFEVPLETLEFAGSVSVRDLNRHEELGTMDCIRLSVPAHGARILKITGKKRIDPSVYEAEWAFIPSYSAITRSTRPMPLDGASGQVAVPYLGGSQDNCLIWNNVYSTRGGKHELSIRYQSDEVRTLEVEVNGSKETVLLPASADFKEYALPVTLKAGFNVVRMGNDTEEAPVVDCFRVL